MADLPENTWSHQASLEFRAVSNRETLAWCMSAKQGRESALLPELQSCCFLISNYFHTSQLTWHLLVLVSNADSPIESYYLMKTSIPQNHIWLCSQQFAEVVITILPQKHYCPRVSKWKCGLVYNRLSGNNDGNSFVIHFINSLQCFHLGFTFNGVPRANIKVRVSPRVIARSSMGYSKFYTQFVQFIHFVLKFSSHPLLEVWIWTMNPVDQWKSTVSVLPRPGLHVSCPVWLLL